MPPVPNSDAMGVRDTTRWVFVAAGAIAVSAVAAHRGATLPATGDPAPYVSAPPGFLVTIVSKHVPGARFMAVAPNGDLVVAQTAAGNIAVIHQGTPPDAAPERFDEDLTLPHGMVFVKDKLYIATWSGVLRYDYPKPHPTVLFKDMPTGAVHNHRALAIADDGTIYVSSGSNCNVCEEGDDRFATILRYSPGDTRGTIYARGLRNASGLAFDPSGRLWAVVNQRDNIGPTQAVTDNLPPDELDLIVKGANYGWPQCYPDPGARRRLPNPEYLRADCSSTRPATFDIPPHSAPLGLVFYEGRAFPKAYQGDAFIALHGSWNRSTPAGDKVVDVSFSGGKPVAMHDFVTGWIAPDETYRNRPVGLAVGADGALYISDDLLGYIYRVTYAP
jgi:glucose/arabinose dehydrogenase